MPNGRPSRVAAVRPTSSPARVILNAVRRMTDGERAEIDAARGLDRAQHDARSADADIDRAFRLAGAVKRAGHERIVLDRIAEHDELGAADRALRRR